MPIAVQAETLAMIDIDQNCWARLSDGTIASKYQQADECSNAPLPEGASHESLLPLGL
jgi:hypothetical protein